LFLATDSNPDVLQRTAARAARKPARGGVQNLICIAEPVEVLADELFGIADRLTVILPWGSLLRGVALPDLAILQHLRRLCCPNAEVEIVFSYDEKRDAGERGPLGRILLSEHHVHGLLPSYGDAGLCITSAERITLDQLAEYETTWAKRLAFGRVREIWRLRGRAIGEAHQ
jgi:16S rRNA (adenine(1408)-N(1))-methyltransferase